MASRCPLCGAACGPPPGYEQRRAELDAYAAQMRQATGRREWRGLDNGDDLRAYVRGAS